MKEVINKEVGKKTKWFSQFIGVIRGGTSDTEIFLKSEKRRYSKFNLGKFFRGGGGK